MKNIISKSVFILLFLVLAGLTTVKAQQVTLTIIDNTGGALNDHYHVSWIVYTLSPYTQWPCSSNDQLVSPVSTPVSVNFFANVNDVKDPVFYVYFRVTRHNLLEGLVGSGENVVGPMTTTQLQGPWTASVTVN